MMPSTHSAKLPPSARALASAYQVGKVNAVGTAQFFLEQIRNLDPRINAFLAVNEEDRLMRQAEEADARIQGMSNLKPTALTGIPFLIKDNISTEGIETTAGSKILKGYVPPFDATVVSRLKSAGALILGKGNLDEFAMGSSNENSAFKPVINPWGENRVPGGSSGGAAAAVAAGECVIALGSDTGGSIRQPASLCGVVGYKPTYGAVSRYGLIAFGSSLDQIGPIARTVADCADTLNFIGGIDPLDSTSLNTGIEDYCELLGREIKGMRVGVPREYIVDGIEPGVRIAFTEAIEVIEGLGAEVEEISLPLTDHALAVYYIIAPSEASANLARFDGVKYGISAAGESNSRESTEATRGAGFGDEVKRRILIGTYALSTGYYDAYYKKAQQVRTLIRREFRQAFSKFDALVTPTSPTVAFELGSRTQDPFQMYLSDVCTIPVNIAGLPGISVPCGLSDGLPVGIQFIAPQLRDTVALQIAHAYEEAANLNLRPTEYQAA